MKENTERKILYLIGIGSLLFMCFGMLYGTYK